MDALRRVLRGEIYLPDALFIPASRSAAQDDKASLLTSRQQEILPLLAEGMPNKKIAQTLGVPELQQLRIKSRGLADRALHRADVRHLRADVEMHELQAVRQAGGLEHFARDEQVRGAQSELCVLPATQRPLSRAFRREPHADSDPRLRADLSRHGENLRQLLELLDDENDALAEFRAEQRILDQTGILVSVADDERFRIVVNRERREKLRLAAGFEAKMKRLSRGNDLRHDFLELVHLDRKDAAIDALIFELLDRRRKRAVHRLDAMPEQIVKPQDHRKFQPLLLRVGDQFHQIDRRLRVLRWENLDVAFFIDAEVIRAPTVNVVERCRRCDVPVLLHVDRRE